MIPTSGFPPRLRGVDTVPSLFHVISCFKGISIEVEILDIIEE